MGVAIGGKSAAGRALYAKAKSLLDLEVQCGGTCRDLPPWATHGAWWRHVCILRRCIAADRCRAFAGRLYMASFAGSGCCIAPLLKTQQRREVKRRTNNNTAK